MNHVIIVVLLLSAFIIVWQSRGLIVAFVRIFKSIVPAPSCFVLLWMCVIKWEVQHQRTCHFGKQHAIEFCGLFTIARRHFATRNGFRQMFDLWLLCFLRKLTESGTPEVLRSRNDATAKLTCGPLVTQLSAWARFDVGSGMRRKWICGAGATLGNLGDCHYSLLVVRCSGSQNRIGISGLDKHLGPVLVHFVH